MSNKKVLVVDDDSEVLEFIVKLLEQYQYAGLTASDSKSMFELLKQHDDIALIILDVMLEDADGISLCKQIRVESMVPIILLTANTSEADRVIGLEYGADDYIHKPFNPRELIARIQTILRRTSAPLHPAERTHVLVYEFLGWQLDTAMRELTSPDNAEVPVTPAEYTLLLTFLQRPRRVLTRDKLLELSKNETLESFDRSIDVLVSRLRRKLEDNSKSPKIIKTIRGGGYMLAVEVNTR